MLRLAFLSSITFANARKFFNSAYSSFLPVPYVRRLEERPAILSRHMKLRPMILSIASILTVAWVATPAKAQTFQPVTPSLEVASAFSTSVLLPSGNVMLIEGTSIAPSSTVQIYNPTTGQYISTPGLKTPLSGVAATLLPDGTVLIVGSTSNAAAAAEIYQPTGSNANTFTNTTGQMITVREYPSATLLPNGYVLIAGGIDSSGNDLNTAELYNPATGTFAPTGNAMHADRYWHTATLMKPIASLPNGGPLAGKVVLAGGADGSGNARNGVEIYDPNLNQFSFLANMVVHRYGQVAYETPQGNLVIAGGCLNYTFDATGLAETYNTSTNSFQQLTNAMTTTRCFASGTVLADGTFLITGGTAGEHALIVNSSAEVFDYTQNTFTAVGPMQTPAAGSSAVAFPFNSAGTTATVLVAGGVTAGTDTDVPNGTPTTIVQLYTYTPNISAVNPKYKVVSLLYSPPGDKSTNGFTKTTTSGTTTAISNSFASGQQVTFNEGFLGINASQSFGVTQTATNSAAFTETFTAATGDFNIGNSDAVDHTNDRFYVWVNPQVGISLDDNANPDQYAVGDQGGINYVAQVLPVEAGRLMPNGLGNTTVKLDTLQPQTYANVQYPGLASICANLNIAEYNAFKCTMADQCGCRPSDFTEILSKDPLLGQPGTLDPASLQMISGQQQSSEQECSDATQTSAPSLYCRYLLAVQPNTPVLSSGSGFQAATSEATSTALTFGQSFSETVKYTFGVGSKHFGFNEGQNFTWTDGESVGTSGGITNSLNLTLETSSLNCEEDVTLYEDTLYHTFAFMVPPSGCGSTTASDTSLAVSPETVIAGGTVTLTATVFASAGGTPTGTVQFLSGTTVVGTATLNSSGVATLSISSSGVPPGAYSASADYLGDSSFPASSSSTVDLNVLSATPTPVTLNLPQSASAMNGNMADSITAADFDKNGSVDVAVAYLEDNVIRVSLNPTGATATYPVGDQPYDVVSGDVNGDGYADLVVVNDSLNSPNGTVSVLLNKGDGSGTFLPAVNYTVGRLPYQVAIGDLNGDGIPDLAVTNFGPSTISILYGSGNGAFTAGPTLTVGTGETNPYGIVIADLQRNGHPDIAVTAFETNTLYVFPNNGDGTFGTPNTYATDVRPASVLVGDFNGDGRPDIVTGNTTANDISFFAGNGDGTFKPGVISPSYNFPVSIAAGDVNGDGILDIVGVSPNANAVAITLGVGDGTFGTASQLQLLPAGQQPWAVVLGNFYNDGKLDIGTANTYNRVNLTVPAYQVQYMSEFPPVSGGNPSVYAIQNTTK